MADSDRLFLGILSEAQNVIDLEISGHLWATEESEMRWGFKVVEERGREYPPKSGRRRSGSGRT